MLQYKLEEISILAQFQSKIIGASFSIPRNFPHDCNECLQYTRLQFHPIRSHLMRIVSLASEMECLSDVCFDGFPDKDVACLFGGLDEEEGVVE